MCIGRGSRPGRKPSSMRGLIEEARALRERFDPGLPAFSAIGYREAWSVLDGTSTLDDAIEEDIRRNVAFAKRQATWFRSEPDVEWLDAAAVAAGVTASDVLRTPTVVAAIS